MVACQCYLSGPAARGQAAATPLTPLAALVCHSTGPLASSWGHGRDGVSEQPGTQVAAHSLPAVSPPLGYLSGLWGPSAGLAHLIYESPCVLPIPPDPRSSPRLRVRFSKMDVHLTFVSLGAQDFGCLFLLGENSRKSLPSCEVPRLGDREKLLGYF